MGGLWQGSRVEKIMSPRSRRSKFHFPESRKYVFLCFECPRAEFALQMPNFVPCEGKLHRVHFRR